MTRLFPKSVVNPLALLRKAGYSHFADPRTGEQSFILRLTAEFYPRMHLYVEEEKNDWSFNLHLDQKKPSYAGTSKHSGEYDGPTVEREMERISRWIAAEYGYYHPSLSGLPAPSEPSKSRETTQAKDDPPEQDLFGGIFG